MSCCKTLKRRLLSAIRENSRRFVLREFQNTQFVGLYAIWFRHRCLYVGKSDQRTVYDRLWKHLASSHNPELKLWIRVKNGDLRFTTVAIKAVPYHSISLEAFVTAAEDLLIETLNPETNIRRTGGRKWLALFQQCEAS